MKVDDQIRNYESTTTGDAVKMSIDESATAHIMDVLTKLYADPELAVVREYSTNALDSHVEAGVTRPIEVTLPTQLSPFLTIRDWGIGLDADGIRDIYSRYGTSTKRGSNEAVGMLGLGCKSALSYTDQFTLTGYKDGIRSEVLISRDEDGAGSMTIVAQEPTDEGNGVKIMVPVKRENEVAAKAAQFFRFWKPGTVLLNGKQPRRIGEGDEFDNIWLDENTLLTTEASESLVVMGQVPYPLVDDESPLFSTGGSTRRYNSRTMSYDFGSEWNAVCFVDIGEVNFAPSRESLMTTKRTKAKMAELRAKITALRDQAIRDQIAAAPTAKEAQELLRKGMSLGFSDRSTAIWQGREVVLELRRNVKTDGQTDYSTRVEDWTTEDALKRSYLWLNVNGYSRKSGERNFQIGLGCHAVIFTGFDGKAMTNVKRAKLEVWCQNNGVECRPGRPMVFVDELRPDEKFWLSGWDVYNWADVAAIDLPKSQMPDGTTTRLKGSYDCVVDGDRQSGIAAARIAELAQGRGLYWMHGNLYSVTPSYPVRQGAVKIDNAIVVCLPANRVDKFCRDFPKAKKLDDAAREAAERWVKSLKPEVITARKVKDALCDQDNVVKLLDPARLDDPTLKDALGCLCVDTAGYDEGIKRFGRWITAPHAQDVGSKTKASEAEKALAKYPLLRGLNPYSRLNREHLHLYINAAYAAGKGV